MPNEQKKKQVFLKYKLRKPCAECPFRKDVPPHMGVAEGLPDLLKAVADLSFSHSCHRTDPRSDYEPAKKYKGDVQHCAGSMIMLLKSNTISAPMIGAVMRGELAVEKLDVGENIYTVQEFIRRYYDWLKSQADAGEIETTEPGV